VNVTITQFTIQTATKLALCTTRVSDVQQTADCNMMPSKASVSFMRNSLPMEQRQGVSIQTMCEAAWEASISDGPGHRMLNCNHH